MKKFNATRKTNETSVDISLCLEGGDITIDTGIGYLNHMLELFSCHGGFGLKIKAAGDLHVDCHHLVEDVGIVLGEVFLAAAGDKKGIARYADIQLPMDETLASVAVDISGRGFLHFHPEFKTTSGFDMSLLEEFFRAFAFNAKLTLHINVLYGKNDHHIAEAIFKATGRTISAALKTVFDKIPSTKGVL